MTNIPRLSRLGRSRLGRGMLVLAAGMYATGVQLENDDAFCASCYVEPETTYYRASLTPDQVATLAAFHAGANTRCIDCHSRQWIPGRIWAQWGRLQNALAFRSGDYTAPAVNTRPVGDGGRSKCHSDMSWVIEYPGHYHSPWLRRDWQAANGPINTFEACHPSMRLSPQKPTSLWIPTTSRPKATPATKRPAKSTARPLLLYPLTLK